MKRPHNERFPSKDPFINADRSNSVPDIAPAPPKRNYKNRLHAAVHASNEINESVSVSSALNSPISNVVGAGHNVPRILGSLSANNAEKKERPKPRLPVYRYEDVYVPPSSELKDFLLSQPPDVVIGDGVEIKGNFQFDGLLRLDGRFQGQFITEDGDLIVGPTGILVSDLTKINRLLIDGGHVFGKIEVASIIISGKALVKGSIICKQLEILDSEATIIGSTHVDPDVLNLQEEELIHPEPSNEPIKVISYNKSKSTKSLHEKMSPEEIQELAKEKAMLEEQEKKTAEDLYNAKLEEKRKRKEAKQKEAKQKEEKEETKEKQREIPSKEKPVEPPSKENKNEPPEPSKVEVKPVEDPPLEKKVESTANEDELKQFTEKRSAKVIQEAWKSNKGSTKPSLKADIDIDEASRKAEKKDLEEARKKEEEERMNKVEALQQKRSAKVIQNAWKSNKSVNSSSSLKPNEANEAEDILEDSLAGNLPPPPVENETVSVEKDDSPILQSHEVHLVSGALGSIPQILIQEKKDESIAEAMEEKSNAENEQKELSSEVTENEMSKYGLSNEENKTIVEASTGENP